MGRNGRVGIIRKQWLGRNGCVVFVGVENAERSGWGLLGKWLCRNGCEGIVGEEYLRRNG